MWRLLNQPYPFSESTEQRLRKAALMGLFVGLFLLVFQPFGLEDWQTPYKWVKILGFGGITFAVTGLHFWLWTRLLPRQFSDDYWTVGREILFIIFIILTIALANLLYLSVLGTFVFSAANLIGAVAITFLVGIFPTAGSVVANYVVQLRKYTQAAAALPVHPHPVTEPVAATTEPRSLLILTAENEKDTLMLAPADLLFVESSDNYCTVVYLKNGQPDQVLLRSSLSRLESQLPVSSIVRCHRSFLVNISQVEKVTGNAQGYKLHLQQGLFLVPVARKYNDSLVAELKK